MGPDRASSANPSRVHFAAPFASITSPAPSPRTGNYAAQNDGGAWGHPQHGHGSSAYPHGTGVAGAAHGKQNTQGVQLNIPTGQVQVVAPSIEAQPWVKDFARWFSQNTVGVARVDLRRPTPPSAEQYEGGNLFFANYKGGAGVNRDSFRRRGKQDVQFLAQQPAGYGDAYAPVARRTPTGARVKITRSFLFWRQPDSETEWFDRDDSTAAAVHDHSSTGLKGGAVHDGTGPGAAASSSGGTTSTLPPLKRSGGKRGELGQALIDVGGGINVDMDRQRVEPVLRLKVKDWFTVKAVPRPVFRLSKLIPLWSTGMGVKVLYEVPLDEVQHFWRPPARLMVRLDQVAGTGWRFTPSGVEFDQQAVRFGRNVQVRASAGLTFPRTLPFDRDADDFGIKVHRLSLKSLW
eukprot:CAMPEP_0202866580 /NCGR_PEP_ID=MMETSP1391-20130828/8031_1 /ASSEMBLY_ACC=CAM_ASM_000867 /TAXON_ID=1034604 /ORGANISM="Chlamydomonas leiostraca, Strain SAG 11-49" /LENGTH=404 /DNA_ID=CAMNT_0049546543 /DNA_START=53 /DNA_END=1267 /DNA_ORIENTATION=-